jgi:hypothetical protein
MVHKIKWTCVKDCAKDAPTITRIIELLVKKELIARDRMQGRQTQIQYFAK